MPTTQQKISVASVPTRLTAMDSARGIGIVLVVFGHAWRGAMGAGLMPDDRLFRLIDAAVYAFHMPLFFLLAGLLFLETLQKYSTIALLQGRLTRLLWPMAVWSWVFFALKFAAGEQANAPVTAADFPLIPLPAYEHLWFLWALFLCQTILIVLYAVLPRQISTSIWRTGAAVVALTCALASAFMYVPSLIWGPMVEHTPYFLLGMAAGGALGARPPVWVGLGMGVLFVVLLTLVGEHKATVSHSLALLVVGWGAWLCLDGSLAGKTTIFRVLRYLGQASMVIYLTHTAFTAALRIVMVKLGADHAAFVILTTTIIGIVAPLGVLWIARRLKLIKLLGF